MAGARSLAKFSVLVTRPEHQSAAFCQSLQLAGAQTTLLPTIEIAFPSLTGSPLQFVQYDLLVFTSANAVLGAIHQVPLPWRNSGVLVAAIGPATTRTLQANGIRVDITPAKHNSEGMLHALSAIDLSRCHIAILRGDSGRNLLIDQLKLRAASVRHIELYQRRLPQPSHTVIANAVARTNITCVGSDLGLCNLAQLLTQPQMAKVGSRPLIVNSERCAVLAGTMGFHKTIGIAAPPGDKGQLQALLKYADTIPD